MNQYFLEKAEGLKQKLNEEVVVVNCNEKQLSQGDSVLYDFGNHYTGYVTFDLGTVGSHPDAPVFIKFSFYEHSRELNDSAENYSGWLSKSWIQEEYFHLDVLPVTLELPRRYAFRYVKIEIIGMSSKHKVVLNNISVKAVSSASYEKVVPAGKNDLERKIDEASLRTLSECMQDVFEDGPKRDRRLWLGDLRLQALANYKTFNNTDLVKRCLYLFAGTADEEGMVSACLFTEPEIEADDVKMFDYSLLFGSVLLDFYNATGDLQTLQELFPTALRQVQLASKYFNENNLADTKDMPWCFIDWKDGLEKTGCAHGVYIYACKAVFKLAELLNEDTEIQKYLIEEIDAKSEAAKIYLFDNKKGIFVSGKENQVSYGANIWLCLAKVFDEKQNGKILDSLKNQKDAVYISTPYMYYHYIQALIEAGKQEEAKKQMIDYWGGMIKEGADTFWELFNPENINEAPYGATVVNSYCHAWSCTPCYFLRTYF